MRYKPFMIMCMPLLAACGRPDFNEEYSAKQKQLNNKMQKIDANIDAEMQSEFNADTNPEKGIRRKNTGIAEP